MLQRVCRAGGKNIGRGGSERQLCPRGLIVHAKGFKGEDTSHGRMLQHIVDAVAGTGNANREVKSEKDSQDFCQGSPVVFGEKSSSPHLLIDYFLLFLLFTSSRRTP